jgi:hypothetical protein
VSTARIPDGTPQGLWADIGPISQGKILTAILQGRRADAELMLRGWSTNDLITLAKAADTLKLLNLQEQVRRDRREAGI